MNQRVALCGWLPGTTGSKLAREVGMHTHTESFWVSQVLWSRIWVCVIPGNERLKRSGQTGVAGSTTD